MTATSPTTKSVAASLSVKVIVAVSPDFRVVLLEVIVIAGKAASIAIGVASEPAVLPLPAASEKAAAATETVPDPVKPAVGVK
ncbi:MAG: hypothetical protein EBT96_10925, partial [Betaproteobacteria bacterium]|nr:hypothetical protein [Betaproteobacteria bacterium]